MNQVVRARQVQAVDAQNASPHEVASGDLASYERALCIAARALAVLSSESALAAMAFRDMSETLGDRVKDGIAADTGGRFHAYAGGVDLGNFATFDAALEAVYSRLLSIR
jgi:hypothetical protein